MSTILLRQHGSSSQPRVIYPPSELVHALSWSLHRTSLPTRFICFQGRPKGIFGFWTCTSSQFPHLSGPRSTLSTTLPNGLLRIWHVSTTPALHFWQIHCDCDQRPMSVAKDVGSFLLRWIVRGKAVHDRSR